MNKARSPRPTGRPGSPPPPPPSAHTKDTTSPKCSSPGQISMTSHGRDGSSSVSGEHSKSLTTESGQQIKVGGVINRDNATGASCVRVENTRDSSDKAAILNSQKDTEPLHTQRMGTTELCPQTNNKVINNSDVNKLAASDLSMTSRTSSCSSVSSGSSGGYGGGKSPRPKFGKSRPAPPPPKPPDKAVEKQQRSNNALSDTPQRVSNFNSSPVNKCCTSEVRNHEKAIIGNRNDKENRGSRGSPAISARITGNNMQHAGSKAKPSSHLLSTTTSSGVGSHLQQDQKTTTNNNQAIKPAQIGGDSTGNACPQSKSILEGGCGSISTEATSQQSEQGVNVSQPLPPPPPASSSPSSPDFPPPPPELAEPCGNASAVAAQLADTDKMLKNRSDSCFIPGTAIKDGVVPGTNEKSVVDRNARLFAPITPPIVSPKPRIKPMVPPPPPPVPHATQPLVLTTDNHSAIATAREKQCDSSPKEQSDKKAVSNATYSHSENTINTGPNPTEMSDMLRDVLDVLNSHSSSSSTNNKVLSAQINKPSSSENISTFPPSVEPNPSSEIINTPCSSANASGDVMEHSVNLPSDKQGDDELSVGHTPDLGLSTEPKQPDNNHTPRCSEQSNSQSEPVGKQSHAARLSSAEDPSAQSENSLAANLQAQTSYEASRLSMSQALFVQTDHKSNQPPASPTGSEHGASSPHSLQYSPLTLASKHNHARGTYSPKRSVRRKKSALGFLLCCGLGNLYTRRGDKTPYELPMRTEGTFPRSHGESVVKSASFPSHIHVPCASTSINHAPSGSPGFSPKRLEQCDVTGHYSDPQIATGQRTGDMVTNTVVNPDTPSPNPTITNTAISGSDSHQRSGLDIRETSPGLDDSKVINPSPDRSLIDVLCTSEQPISLDKLSRDNKYLVVTPPQDKSASPGPSTADTPLPAIDRANRPVVHCVKLIKPERRATVGTREAPTTAGQHFVHSGAPRLSCSYLQPPHGVGDRPVLYSSFRGTTSPLISPRTTEQTGDQQRGLPPQEEEVKLRQNSQSTLSKRDPAKVRSQSMEDLSTVILDLDLDLTSRFARGKEYRSSFVGSEDLGSKPALTRAPGEVQTMLKHNTKEDQKVYALPQPACYSDNTLKAVRLITDKYDTLERWKVCATSFNGDGKRGSKSSGIGPPSRQASRDSNAELLEGISEDSGARTNSEQRHPGTNSADSVDGRNVGSSEENRGVCDNPVLSPKEMARIRLFYSSRETSVWTAQCCIDLLFSSREVEKAADVKEWQPGPTGVPTLVLNSGKGRTRRELHLVVAERATSFPLWSDRINHLSHYATLSPTRHSLHLSNSLLKVVALEFPHEELATDFMTTFKEITSDPSDELWKVAVDPKVLEKRVKKSAKMAQKTRKLRGDISRPIQFDHVTYVSANDPSLAAKLPSMLVEAKTEGSADEPFRTRSYSG